MTVSDFVTVPAEDARHYLDHLFQAAGVDSKTAAIVADGLVEADVQGVNSHGALQAPMYLRRIRAGTMSTAGEIKLVHRSAAVSVFDAGLVLGHAVARQVMDVTIASARDFGIACSSVRSATHFGVAGHYAQQAAEAGMIGIVMCNTRQMLPAPGGTQAVVGNNPLAIAVPSAGRPPIVFDMAMSAGAMGKIRMAERLGQTIPEGWAVDQQGNPTTNAAAAVAGMLLPAAGAKGFGLALMIDFICALSGGAAGSEVGFLYGDPATPAESSWFMIVLDPAHFGLKQPFDQRVEELAKSLLNSPVVNGAEPVSLPGDRKLKAAQKAAGMVRLPASLVADLDAISLELGGPARLGGKA